MSELTICGVTAEERLRDADDKDEAFWLDEGTRLWEFEFACGMFEVLCKAEPSDDGYDYSAEVYGLVEERPEFWTPRCVRECSGMKSLAECASWAERMLHYYIRELARAVRLPEVQSLPDFLPGVVFPPMPEEAALFGVDRDAGPYVRRLTNGTATFCGWGCCTIPGAKCACGAEIKGCCYFAPREVSSMTSWAWCEKCGEPKGKQRQ